MDYTFDDYKKSAEYILSTTEYRPETAIVLGSGLGGFDREVGRPCVIPYSQIPGFPVSTAPSHAGRLLLGRIEGTEIFVLSGRFHYYEGWSFKQAAYYVGVLKLLGIKNLILTNAAGCISEELHPGDLMIVKDHLNFSGKSPCIGENIGQLGERFFDMSDAYTAEFRNFAKDCAEKTGVNVKEGVYAYMTGPQYETPAEIRALRMMGADAVGMSTVPEVIEAAHCGIRVLCISCITNYAAGLSGDLLSSQEVTEKASEISDKLCVYVKSIINGLK